MIFLFKLMVPSPFRHHNPHWWLNPLKIPFDTVDGPAKSGKPPKRMVETLSIIWDVYHLSTGDSDFAGPSTVIPLKTPTHPSSTSPACKVSFNVSGRTGPKLASQVKCWSGGRAPGGAAWECARDTRGISWNWLMRMQWELIAFELELNRNWMGFLGNIYIYIYKLNNIVGFKWIWWASMGISWGYHGDISCGIMWDI